MIKVKFISILFIVFLFLTSCGTKNDYYEIYDGITNSFKLYMPFEKFEYSMRFDGLNFWFDDDYDLAYISNEFNKAGYLISEKKANDIDYKILSMYDNDKVVELFQLYKNTNGEFVVDNLSCSRGGVVFSFPYYQFDEMDFHIPLSIPIDYDTFDEYLVIAELKVSFYQLIDFYKSSLCNILYENTENNYIIINAVDRKKGNTFNSLIKIEFFSEDNHDFVKYKRIISF